jgi:uncharacterized protein (TIGR01319 family)
MSRTGAVWLFDIGSTYTKVAVAGARGELVTARVPTQATDLMRGVDRAARATGVSKRSASAVLACSSAAGGLALVVSGFVPRLSLEAGKQAALGAGARLVGAWGYRLNSLDIAAIEERRPHVVLLTGGIDGGDRDVILSNAQSLCGLRTRPAIVVAGNREATDDVADMLRAAGFTVRPVANLLPELGVIDPAPARGAIRELFLERIAHGPGLEAVSKAVDGDIVPTPAAVLDGLEHVSSVGSTSAIAVEVGGATTNVHSCADGGPAESGVVIRGLPPEFRTRTVEGDLGVRHNVDNVAELAGPAWFERHAAPVGHLVGEYVTRVHGTAYVATNDAERMLDRSFALFCIATALVRHAGRVERRPTMVGEVMVQQGKDLRRVELMIATGGAVIQTVSEQDMVMVTAELPESTLLPTRPRVVTDRGYVLYAVGLLARWQPKLATALAERAYLTEKRGVAA